MSKLKLRSLPFVLTILVVLAGLFLAIPSGSGVFARQNLQDSSPTPTPVPGESGSTIYATVITPPGVLAQPYIILQAFGDIPAGDSVEIRGMINDQVEFTCSGNPCELSLTVDSVISFQVFTSSGAASVVYSATVRVAQAAGGGYTVVVEALTPIVTYVDRCASLWGLAGAQPGWARFPQSPIDLRTGEALHYLAGRLIEKQIVDASDCPNGGMSGTGPNACGLEKARQAMIVWQNRYDFDIWLAAKDVGIPPRLVKTLIMRESQYWPGNSRYFVAEFGLAQINDFGADVALRWDYDLYKLVCEAVLSDCTVPYMARSSSSRAMLRGALIELVNANCPTCQYSLDMEVAHSSVETISHILYASCKEASYVLSSNKVGANNYEDMWKFTMVNYHSGIYCLDVAVKAAATEQKIVDWQTVSPKLSCPGAKQYVDEFWNSLTTFDSKVIPYEPSDVALVKSAPKPTPTMVPTPVPVLSSARILVHVFVDKNINNLPEAAEGVSGVIVQLLLANGQVIFGVTDRNGEVVFLPRDQLAGQSASISLLGLYRSQTITLPEKGEVKVLFKFNQPNLPTNVP